MHLTQTIKQFRRLGNIEIGNTKGKTLTNTIHAIYAEFQASVDLFMLVKYEIMDIEQRAFDDDFYKFRLSIKELERRLASVLT